MAEVVKVVETSFANEVLASPLPVLVDFSAAWCGPCKRLDPVIDELAEEWCEKVKIVRVDVDDSPNIAMDYQVMGVPTLLLFKNGQPVERTTGYMPKDRLEKKFIPHL